MLVEEDSGGSQCISVAEFQGKGLFDILVFLVPCNFHTKPTQIILPGDFTALIFKDKN